MQQDYLDAGNGFMAGYNDRDGGKVKWERKIRRTDLRDGMGGIVFSANRL